MYSHPFSKRQTAFQFKAHFISGADNDAVHIFIKQVIIEFLKYSTFFCKVQKLYENYLSGMALAKAAAAAGIETYHGTAKRLMENRHYLGDDFYPAIIDQETYDKAAAIRFERAGKLGRLSRKKSVKPAASPTGFRIAAAEQHYEDPRLQAEYLYSLIESEVS